MAHTSPRNETQQHPSTHNDTQPNTMTLKEIIEGCFSRLGRVAATGIIIASSSASATPLVPVDWHQSNNPYTGIALGQGQVGDIVNAGRDGNSTDKYKAEDMSPTNPIGYYFANFGSANIIDQASTGFSATQVYHLVNDGVFRKVLRTSADEQFDAEATQIGDNETFAGYDHIAAVSVNDGVNDKDYLVLVDKGTSSEQGHYKVFDPEEGWVGDAIPLPTNVGVHNTTGAGAYMAATQNGPSQNLSNIVLGLSFPSSIRFYTQGHHLAERNEWVDIDLYDFGIYDSFDIHDVAFNHNYQDNTIEVYVASQQATLNPSLGLVARLQKQGGGSLEMYQLPAISVSGSADSGQEGDWYNITLSADRPVEIPTTVYFALGGTAQKGSDYQVTEEQSVTLNPGETHSIVTVGSSYNILSMCM